MRVWSQLCRPEPRGTPAEVFLHHQNAVGRPRSLALSSLFYLIKGKLDNEDFKKRCYIGVRLLCRHRTHELCIITLT